MRPQLKSNNFHHWDKILIQKIQPTNYREKDEHKI
jgi:hypothetical protein